MATKADVAPKCEVGSRLETEVAFSVHAETNLGDRVLVVGSAQALGAWNPDVALELQTGPASYPCWSGAVRLLGDQMDGSCIEYKFVIVRQSGGVDWEGGHNRQLTDTKLSHEHVNVQSQSPQAPLFGQVAPDGPCGHRFTRPRGVPRVDLSLASTCALDDDSMSGACTSRCASSVCLLTPTRVREEEEGEEWRAPASLAPARLWSGAHRVSKPEGLCEDAYFFSSCAAGVADGVGQMSDYADYGVDAAAYADELMERAAMALGRSDGTQRLPCDRTADAVATAEATTTTYGASTITVLALNGSDLGVTNLGDSGFMLLRAKPWGMDLIERSREQEHSWNCPYQLSSLPEALAKKAGGRRFDTAEDCEHYRCTVELGDLILLFTDGLTDNLHWYEMVRIVDQLVLAGPCESKPEPDVIAQALVQAAYEKSLDEEAETPFSKKARRHRLCSPGGKTDDITVVAAWVASSEQACETGATEVILSCPHDPAGSRRTGHELEA
mmetsp:Transcript_91883/g.230956  ORF Transcript_91883/g.230956 Transcript_91883/m.230956 type:complete len:499 (+) Transcript_91883:94-1590(+)